MGHWLRTATATIAAALTCASVGVRAWGLGYAESDAGWVPIDKLMRIRVVTASRLPEELRTAASPVAILTSDDIRRSGATNLPEALRLVAGVDVARVNASRYSVAIRGFAGEFADKLLVLIDGRSVYNPQFGGVFWDMQDILLEDIERIEVVRGPGGTAWGANAMCGVINVVSKSAKDTQGGLYGFATGTLDTGQLTIRQGVRVGEGTWLRTFAKGRIVGPTPNRHGVGSGDGYSSALGGFRLDSELGNGRSLTVGGGLSYVEPLQYLTGKSERFPAFGGHVLGRYRAEHADGSSDEVQVYYDVVRRDMVQNALNTDTIDLDARHVRRINARNLLHVAAGQRVVYSKPTSTSVHIFDPSSRYLRQSSVSVEDEVQVVPDVLSLTAGGKAEYYDLTGKMQFLPGARLSYAPTPASTFWASLSSGAQVPTTADHDLTINSAFYRALPDDAAPTQKVTAYQAGWRGSSGQRTSFDVSTFVHRYYDLPTLEVVDSGTPPTLQRASLMHGQSKGLELGVTHGLRQPTRIRVAYSYIDMRLETAPGSTDTSSAAIAGRSPRHQGAAWFTHRLGSSLDVDAVVRWVGDRPSIKVGPYASLDVRLSYRHARDSELTLVGQDLLAPRHKEMNASPGFPSYTSVPRRVFLQATWRR